ncbi:hypothetical protein GCM10007359_03470 [Rothia aerolata]|uniref:Preprotein translocase subunit YajC n=2 Tax=Rothia aerolata TaxID=1812262 RepID=A0A917IM62_9MICC|nr:hypothetical protein GCM10007359_03470 [Rothia aerolata]
MGPGTEVMTNFGLYGRVVEVNRDENFALLEVHSGAVVKVHLQTVTTVLDASAEEASAQPQAGSAQTDSTQAGSVAEGEQAEPNRDEFYRPDAQGDQR